MQHRGRSPGIEGVPDLWQLYVNDVAQRRRRVGGDAYGAGVPVLSSRFQREHKKDREKPTNMERFVTKQHVLVLLSIQYY